MERELQIFGWNPKVKIDITQSNTQKYQIGKLQAMMVHLNSELKSYFKVNRYLEETDIRESMTKGKTILIQRDLQKGTAPNNYIPITYLPMTWKVLTAQIREKFTFH